MKTRYISLLPSVILAVSMLIFVPTVSAELLYDPITNSYIDTNAPSNDGVGSSALPTSTIVTSVFGYVTLSDGSVVYQEIAPAPIEVVPPASSSTGIQVGATTTALVAVTSQDLEDLLIEVQVGHDDLQAYVSEQENLAREQIQTSISQSYTGVERRDLTCMEVIKDLDMAQAEAASVIAELANKIQAKSDLIISGLEKTLARAQGDIIKGAVLEAEYLTYVDELESYIEGMSLATETTIEAIKVDVLDYVDTQVAKTSLTKLQKISDSRLLRNGLQTNYDTYKQNTDVMHNLFADRLVEFTDAGNLFFDLFSDAVSKDRYEDHGVSQLTTQYIESFISSQEGLFQEYVHRSTDATYPMDLVEELEVGYQALAKTFDGEDCQDLLSMTTLAQDVKALDDAIVQADLIIRSSYAEMGSPTSWNQVEEYTLNYFNEFMRDVLQANYNTFIDQNKEKLAYQKANNISTHIIQYNPVTTGFEAVLGTIRFPFSTTQKNRTEQVVSFLSMMRGTYISNDNEAGFDLLMSTGYEKAKIAYASLPSKTSKTAHQLESIMAGIYIYLQ